ncbi:MAG: TIGR02391 family protein [Acidimicrobiales bacterium]|nr:TIGR02391 family protein [Acidimicrobiales bacterium]MYB81758.1 TIGR02391 family protein [Acidimicrobiales bacterium]MYI13686.1 TIGR02391 family protein [Acidimicrobiales bacterium]
MARAKNRSAAVRALDSARALDAEVRHIGFGPFAVAESATDEESTFDAVDDDDSLIAVSRALFLDGHYASAVFEAYKCLNNFVKVASGSIDLDGAQLMNHVFSPKRPVLVLSDLNSASRRDEQLGYMQILAGVMTGVRNPRAHEHGFKDDPKSALELLGLANHLMRVVRRVSTSG